MEQAIYENNTGAVLLISDDKYLCEIPDAESDGKELNNELGKITTSYTLKRMVELVYSYGALTKNAIIYLFSKDSTLSDALKKPSAIENVLSTALYKSLILKCQCCYYDEKLERTVIRYEYYITNPALAKEMEHNYGFNYSQYLSSMDATSRILSSAQISALLTEDMAELDIKRGSLRDSITPYLKQKYHNWTIYISSLRSTKIPNDIKDNQRKEIIEEANSRDFLTLSELSKKMNGRLESTRTIIVCENTIMIRETAEKMMNLLKQTQLYGFLFTSDFSYNDKALNLLEVKNTLEGIKLIPVTLF